MSSAESFAFAVEENQVGLRLDKYLAEQFPDKTRTSLQKLIDSQAVLVNGQEVSKNYKLKAQDCVTVENSRTGGAGCLSAEYSAGNCV